MTPLEEKHLEALSNAHAPLPTPTPTDTLDMQYNATDKYPGPCRDSALSIAEQQVREHQRELTGWTWLRDMLKSDDVPKATEEALYEIFSRVRRF